MFLTGCSEIPPENTNGAIPDIFFRQKVKSALTEAIEKEFKEKNNCKLEELKIAELKTLTEKQLVEEDLSYLKFSLMMKRVHPQEKNTSTSATNEQPAENQIPPNPSPDTFEVKRIIDSLEKRLPTANDSTILGYEAGIEMQLRDSSNNKRLGTGVIYLSPDLRPSGEAYISLDYGPDYVLLFSR